MRANSERGRDFEDQQLELVWEGIGNEGKLQGQKGHNEREPLMITPIMISSNLSTKLFLNLIVLENSLKF